MYEIIPVDGRLFAVNTTTKTCYVRVMVDTIANKADLMLELCRAIVRIERAGAIVTSVQEVTADGHRPRVSYRQSREYKQAQKEPKRDVVPAIYVSYWSSGAVFRAPCRVDMVTREVFDIQSAGHPCDDDDCYNETVEINEEEIPVYCIDEICDLNADSPLEELTEIKENNSYWRSCDGRKLDEEIKKYQ